MPLQSAHPRHCRVGVWAVPRTEGGEEMKTVDDLEARVMNRLQAMKRGQTIHQLQTYLSEPQGKILAVLIPLRNVGRLRCPRAACGLWFANDSVDGLR